MDDDNVTSTETISGSLKGYYSNGDFIFDTDDNWDLDWPNYYAFTASATDTVYILVYPYSEGNTGTFSIVYNTSGSQPAMSVSSSSLSRSVLPNMGNSTNTATDTTRGKARITSGKR